MSYRTIGEKRKWTAVGAIKKLKMNEKLRMEGPKIGGG